MTSRSQTGYEIHVAGHAKNVLAGQAPHWRYRLGAGAKELALKNWVVTGEMHAGNNTHGVERGASFLLWWSLRGRITIKDTVAYIHLAPSLDRPPVPDNKHRLLYQKVPIRIFASPARASQGLPPPHWRGEVESEKFDLSQYSVQGQATTVNVRPGVDIAAPDPTRRLWLEFYGDFALDDDGNALISLA